MPDPMSNDELQLRLHSQDFLQPPAATAPASPQPSTDPSSAPPRKPTPPPIDKPEAGGDANSMSRLMDTAASMTPKINASNLKSDHPYGDGGYSEMPSQTMMRLGAGTQYGSK